MSTWFGCEIQTVYSCLNRTEPKTDIKTESNRTEKYLNRGSRRKDAHLYIHEVYPAFAEVGFSSLGYDHILNFFCTSNSIFFPWSGSLTTSSVSVGIDWNCMHGSVADFKWFIALLLVVHVIGFNVFFVFR